MECFSREVTPHIELYLCIDKVLTKLDLHLTILSSDKHKHQLITFILFVLRYVHINEMLDSAVQSGHVRPSLLCKAAAL